MARFIGNTVNKFSGGGGVEVTYDYTRASGITTDANNNVTAVTLGPRDYSSILYNNVGLITSFVENINGLSKTYTLTYDANYNVVSIVGAF